MAKKKTKTKKVALPNRGEKQRRIEEVLLMLEQGEPSRDCVAHLVNTYKIHKNNARNYLTEAYKQAEASSQKDKTYVFSVHMERYESIYKSAMWKIRTMIPPEPEQYKALSYTFREAMQALQAKEKLLGLHSKLVRVEVNNRVASIEIEQVKGPIKGYDYKKLSIEELMELSTLFQKGRLVEVEGILPIRYKKYIAVEVEEAQIVEEEETQLPEKVVDKLIQDNEAISRIPITTANPEEVDKTLWDLKDKLKQTAIEQYRQAMRRKQGNKEHPE